MGLWNRPHRTKLLQEQQVGEQCVCHCSLLSPAVLGSKGEQWQGLDHPSEAGYCSSSPWWLLSGILHSPLLTALQPPCNCKQLHACLCYRVTAPSFYMDFPPNIGPSLSFRPQISVSRYSWSPLGYSLAPYYPIFSACLLHPLELELLDGGWIYPVHK